MINGIELFGLLHLRKYIEEKTCCLNIYKYIYIYIYI